MAICAQIDASGFVKELATVALNDCTGFVLLDKADFVSNGLVQTLITIPAGEDFATAWSAGFIPPMTIGLIAWSVAKIVNMWR
jgi:hypothetical protein